MIIDKNYSIEVDKTDGVVLIFSEEKDSKDKDAVEGKKVFQTRYYYPTILSALKKYLDVALEKATNVEHCIQLIEQTYSKIETQLKQTKDGK